MKNKREKRFMRFAGRFTNRYPSGRVIETKQAENAHIVSKAKKLLPSANETRNQIGDQVINARHQRSRSSSSSSRLNNPRTSGLVAVILLAAMLITAALSSVSNARASNEPLENTAAAQTASLQLAKEYVYAGSRMLAVEDYGISSTPTPTPTATPATPTPTPPTPTPTPPTPTPTPAPDVPSIASVAQSSDPTCLNITLNGVSEATSYDVKILDSGYTVSVTDLSFPWCGLQPGTYYEYQARAVNQYGTSAWSATVGGTTSTPPPTPTPIPNDYSPVGVLDSADGASATISGWSYDPDNPSASNQVHIYINGPAGSGTGYAVTADVSRPDVNSAYGITGNHGFSFTIPNEYLDGQQHSVYAYGIDTGANNPTLLNNSPLYFQYPVPSCHPGQLTLRHCEDDGGTWNYDTCQCDYPQRQQEQQ